jgi:hypothetical protein
MKSCETQNGKICFQFFQTFSKNSNIIIGETNFLSEVDRNEGKQSKTEEIHRD